MRYITIAGLLALSFGCGKGDRSCRDGGGGFIPNYSRVFFKARNFGGGDITLEITKEDGALLKRTIQDTWATPGATCATTSSVARVDFSVGTGGTWKAYDRTRTWNGTIGATCDANSCETIELK